MTRSPRSDEDPSLTCLLDQTDADDSRWRDAEAAVFVLLERLRRGRGPPADHVDGLPESARRRLGYLCDLACLRLDPTDPAALGALAERIRSSLPPDPPPIGAAVPVVPVPHRRRPADAYDAVGGWWGIHPPLDLRRFEAEREALIAEAADASYSAGIEDAIINLDEAPAEYSDLTPDQAIALLRTCL